MNISTEILKYINMGKVFSLHLLISYCFETSMVLPLLFSECNMFWCWTALKDKSLCLTGVRIEFPVEDDSGKSFSILWCKHDVECWLMKQLFTTGEVFMQTWDNMHEISRPHFGNQNLMQKSGKISTSATL